MSDAVSSDPLGADVKQTLEIGKGKPGPGRPKGLPNKTNALLKDAILKAAALADPAANLDTEGTLEGYLKWAAKETPGPFLGLIGKVLPMQVTGEDGDKLRIIITGVPRAED